MTDCSDTHSALEHNSTKGSRPPLEREPGRRSATLFILQPRPLRLADTVAATCQKEGFARSGEHETHFLSFTAEVLAP